MKIYFCDICNESIPLKDINSNRITIEDGKIFCQQCAPKRERATEGIPKAVTAGFLVLMVAIVGLSVALFSAHRQLDEIGNTLADGLDSLGTTKADQVALDAQAVSRRELAESLRGEFSDLSQGVAKLQRQVSDVESRQDRGERDFVQRLDAATKDMLGRLSVILELQKELTEQRVAMGGLGVRVDGFDERLSLLQEMLSNRESAPRESSEEVVAKGTPESTGPSEAETREIDGYIAKLQHTDPGERYPAIIALGRFSSDKAVQALENALADPEDYIRVAAIQKLRSLGAVRSVPQVIAKLRDGDYFVRMTAGNALPAMTGHTIEFVADGAEGERERAAQSWERWWEKNRDRMLRDG